MLSHFPRFSSTGGNPVLLEFFFLNKNKNYYSLYKGACPLALLIGCCTARSNAFPFWMRTPHNRRQSWIRLILYQKSQFDQYRCQIRRPNRCPPQGCRLHLKVHTYKLNIFFSGLYVYCKVEILRWNPNLRALFLFSSSVVPHWWWEMLAFRRRE